MSWTPEPSMNEWTKKWMIMIYNHISSDRADNLSFQSETTVETCDTHNHCGEQLTGECIKY